MTARLYRVKQRTPTPGAWIWSQGRYWKAGPDGRAEPAEPPRKQQGGLGV